MSSRTTIAPGEGSSPVFTCTQCGDCCIGYGGTYVTTAQMQVIAEYIGMTPGQFATDKCRQSGGKLVLTQGEDGHCTFWDGNCTIYPVRPDMCRKWPFIENILRDVSNWSAMANSCPGMRRDVSDDEISGCVRSSLERFRCETLI